MTFLHIIYITLFYDANAIRVAKCKYKKKLPASFQSKMNAVGYKRLARWIWYTQQHITQNKDNTVNM